MKDIKEIWLKHIMLKAYMAGADSMYCGCYDLPDEEQFNKWFESEFKIEDKDH